MAKDSRVTRSNKAANVKAKNKSGRANRRAKISTMEEASGFQRSGRDTGSSKSEVGEIPPSAKKSSSSNQQTTVTTPSALGTRRSGRLKKRAPETELEERNPKRAVASVRSSSAMRRSERVKRMSSSSPVESMKLEASAGSVRVKRKERSLNELTKETREDDKGNERGVEQVRRKIKTMHTRDYKALLKRKVRNKLVVQDQGQVSSVSAKLSKEDNNPCTTSGCDQVDQGSECNKREEGGADCSEEKEKGLKAQCEGVVDNSSPTATEVTMRECGHMELPPEIPEYMKDAYETAAKGETHDTRSSHNSAEDVCFSSANCGQNLADSFCQTESGELKAGKASANTNDCRSHGEAQEMPLYIHGDDDHDACFNCKHGGDLLCCEGKGCKKSYHRRCLDPPLTNFPLETWYCIGCVKKKIKYGVHLVSKGIESIWDVREIDVTGNKEKQKQKQYYVKYKGLAPVHNCWKTESELLHESPSLAATFMQKSQFIKWKAEWSVPQRLLQKRQLIFPKQLDEYGGEKNGDCLDFQYEWLVKWCGLDYDQVTWELENSRFLNTPEAQRLKIAYENRHKAKSDSTGVKKKGSFVKLSQLPAGSPLESAKNYLKLINKLREFWFKGQNAVLVEDSERMSKVIQFLVSLESSISSPILIVASSDELLGWEREFLHLAPSINVVIYSGNNDVRLCIRTLENFNEQAKTTFQVLITTGEVLTEDLEVLACLGWEIIIIDECQRSDAWVHFGHIKRLTVEMRVLLLSGKLKETVAGYSNLLSLLYCPGGSVDRDDLKTISSHDIVSLKNKISEYLVRECKFDSPPFVEYWVPAQASNVQLEHYCATLFSNSLSLCSSSKKDPVDILCDIIMRNRKCCDHPYIVDPSVQGMMIKDLHPIEYLDVGVKASGKLQLLDLMLSEIKKMGLRVLILFQTVGIGKDSVSLGNILDDYMRQRFGSDSYERIDVLHSKKQASLDNFNNKEGGRFVLLLEAKACSPSIKLASIDTVIIYGSDWIPSHDYKNLQKISFRSQFDQMKVFRLYSSCTLEEKVLIHVKQNMTLDSPHNKFRNTNHKLLMWGASYLFERLEDFQSCNEQGLDASITSQDAHLRDVLKEFSAILDGSNNSGNCSIVSKVEHNGVTYDSDNLLLGETVRGLSDEVLPHIYWTRLLDGKHPQWKYVSDFTQRNRKRAHHMGDPAKKLDVEIAEVSKKRKKVVKDQGHVKFKQNNVKTSSGDKEGRASLHGVQKSFHRTVKSEVLKLCRALQLSDDIEGMVRRFLAYVMTNHHVPDKPTTIIQAFQMALCWTAATLVRKKIDHKASIAHAKEHLSYECTEEEAKRVYSKLRCLKIVFSLHSDGLREADHSTPGTKDGTEIAKMVKMALSKSLRKIENKCNKQMVKLLQKQEEERKELLAICEEDRAQLEKSQKFDAAVLRFSTESNAGLREDKLKSLDDEYKKRFKENEKQRQLHLRCLDEIQLAARKKEEKRASSWVEEINSWAHHEILDKLSPDGFNKLASASHDIANQSQPDKIEFLEEIDERLTIPEIDTHGNEVCQDSTGISDVRPSGLSGNLYRKISAGTKTNNTEQSRRSCCLVGDIGHISEQLQDTAAVRSCNCPETCLNADIRPSELNSEKSTISPIGQARGNNMPEPSLCHPKDNVITEISHSVKTHGDGGLSMIFSSNDPSVDVPINRPSFEVDNPVGTFSAMSDRQCPSGQPTTVGASDCVDGVTTAGENVQNLSVQAGDSVTSAAELTTILSSNSSDNALPNLEPIAEAIELMQMRMSTLRMSTSFPVNVVGSRQSTREVPVSGPLTLPNASLPQQISEVHRPSQVVQAPMQLSENIMSQPNHTTTSEPARIQIPMYSGPLQSELERIRKAIDDNKKLQQEKKLQLGCDCEKEIAEVVAQIRQKYKAMFQDIEAEYGAKCKELERNHDKVLMNQILAEAFKSKCMDGRPTSGPGRGQDGNSNFRQQLALNQSSQQTLPGPSSAPISLAGHPTSSSQNTAGLRLQHIIPPAVSPMAPNVQGIRHFPAPFPPRPAEGSHLSPPTSTLVGVVIRAMAPALQHRRSSMSTTRSPLHSRPISTLPVFAHLPSQIQPRASPSVPYIRPQWPGIARGSPDIPNASPTAVSPENQPVVNSSNILPEFVHMSPGLAVQSRTNTQDRMQSTSARNAEADIVSYGVPGSTDGHI